MEIFYSTLINYAVLFFLTSVVSFYIGHKKDSEVFYNLGGATGVCFLFTMGTMLLL